MTQTPGENAAQKIVRRHYGLKRQITSKEVQDEIDNLKRRGLGNLDDNAHMLAAKLDVFGHNPYDSRLNHI